MVARTVGDTISAILKGHIHSKVLDIYDASGSTRIHVLVSGAGRELPGLASLEGGEVIQDAGWVE